MLCSSCTNDHYFFCWRFNSGTFTVININGKTTSIKRHPIRNVSASSIPQSRPSQLVVGITKKINSKTAIANMVSSIQKNWRIPFCPPYLFSCTNAMVHRLTQTRIMSIAIIPLASMLLTLVYYNHKVTWNFPEWVWIVDCDFMILTTGRSRIRRGRVVSDKSEFRSGYLNGFIFL